MGDAAALLDHARGGDDSLTNLLPNATFGDPTVIGDALTMTKHAVGGDDTLRAGGANGANPVAYGDALEMNGHALGGNDQISVAATFAQATGYGDAKTMSGHAQGGNDSLSGSAPGPFAMYGDAETMSGFAHGGADTLDTGGYGDARTLNDHAQGGDDVLYGGFQNPLYGDGLELLGHAQGGNDTLISGAGADTMYGDAQTVAPGARTGADLFVFSPPNGQDQIMDFEPGKDHIELKGSGFTSFQDLASHIQDTVAGSLISFDASDSILVANVHQLGAGDFVFT